MKNLKVSSLTQNFNPRACGRRDRKFHTGIERLPISIHAPAGGATAVAATQGEDLTISIHAPAGGATCSSVSVSSSPSISIHAPAGGATSQRYAALLSIEFQSTRLREARPEQSHRSYAYACISIHAPAGGAT